MSNLRRERLRRLRGAGLYLVTDDRLSQSDLLGSLDQALAAGVRVVQFRAKNLERREFFRQAGAVQVRCIGHQALFIVNDAVDVAALLGADGVHVGQDDLPADAARQLVGPDALVGVSISAVADAREATSSAEVDYLGVGSMFPTATKPSAEYGGLDLLRAVRKATDLPLVAIGGISLERAPDVWSAGADLIAVVTAVFASSDPGAAARELLRSSPRPTVDDSSEA